MSENTENKQTKNNAPDEAVGVEHMVRPEYKLGEWNDPSVDPPENGIEVLAVLEHCGSGNKRYAVIVHIEADDYDWEFDNQELSYDFDVLLWAYLPKFPV